jgi:hypothetical protein
MFSEASISFTILVSSCEEFPIQKWELITETTKGKMKLAASRITISGQVSLLSTCYFSIFSKKSPFYNLVLLAIENVYGCTTDQEFIHK